MSSCTSAPTPWVRKSTAQGRRRVSLRLRKAHELEDQRHAVSSAFSIEREERGTKRGSSPVGASAKRMRLLECEEEEQILMEEREHDNSIEENREDEDENGTGDTDTHMQVTSSYSSSSDGRSVYEEYDMDGEEEEYLEEEDIEDEECFEGDKTEIITSDEDEHGQENWRVDGPLDSYGRMQRFRKLSVELGQRFEMIPLKEPRQLTNRCHGVGPAAEVWSVLCHKDDLHSICNENFMRDHNPRDPIPANYRAVLIDWMQEVCWAEKLHRETFHLAIDYVDRVMAKGVGVGMRVRTAEYQLLGTTALFIAAKYEEIYPPKVEDIVQYTADACDTRQVRKLEMVMLKVLEWELNVVTPLHWCLLFLELLTGNPKSSSSASSRFSLMQQSNENDGHYYEGQEETELPELPATTGSCARDDYMHISYIMDAVILHDVCRKYSNRVLATATLYSIYDAEEAIHQVTGLSCTDDKVKDAIDWIHPIVVYCEKMKDHNAPMPVIEGIRPDAVHTIQLYRGNVSNVKKIEDVLAGVQQYRVMLLNERENRRRSAPIRLGSLENIDE